MVRISVIIPTRNRAADLRRCLDGLAECAHRLPVGVALAQVVVVDDASTDPEATAPARDTGLPLVLLRNPVRLGAGASRRRAVEVADGDVLAFLDDDAVPRGDWLAVAAGVDADRPGITGRVLGFDAGLVSRARQARYDARYRDLGQGTPVNFFACGNGAVLASAFHRVGGFSNEGVGGDNSLARSLDQAGTPVRFHPDLVIAHRNGKGWTAAVHNAWSAGTNHPQRMTVTDLLDTGRSSAVGDNLAVRELNRALGVLHALGRLLPRAGDGTTQPTAPPHDTEGRGKPAAGHHASDGRPKSATAPTSTRSGAR
ncbi:glycosyltransferase family 2 protein [Streptomyces sp. NBC_00078]|uniref:glycosyltransferase family 2 protein n=1 Tax=unclassified Streptomyces TaxID=2593676 RepID=UPI0022501D0A|nr:glycosyltransferase family 2 protein [Streptomyces sp. NBC_00078]MCX5426154.1 glycosyltransferase [Streptomyces sp. NBC_00078]